MRTYPPARKLLLNISPITFNDSTVKVGVFEIDGVDQNDRIKQKLRLLRTQHNRSHIFRREQNRILAIPYVAGATQVGDAYEEIALFQNLNLSAALIRNALINFLHGMGRQIIDYSPIKFVADKQADLLDASTPSDLTKVPWLSVRPSYEIDIRVITFDREQPFVGAVLNVRTTRLITKPCDALVSEGFPIGRLVRREIP